MVVDLPLRMLRRRFGRRRGRRRGRAQEGTVGLRLAICGRSLKVPLENTFHEP